MPASRWGDDRYNPSLVTPVATIADLAGLPGTEGDTVRCMDPRFGGAGILYRHDGQRWTRGPIRRGNRASWSPRTLGENGGATVNTGQTRQIILRAPDAFSRVRVWFSTTSGTAVTPVGRVNLAVSNSGASFQPSVGGAVTEDESTGWVTYAASFPQIPARTQPSVGAGWANSGWLDIQSIPATDGGRPWLFLRFSQVATGLSADVYDATVGDTTGSECVVKALTDGTYAYVAASSDAAGALFDATSVGIALPIMRIDFATDSDFESVDLVGASTIGVHGGTNRYIPFGRLANRECLQYGITLTSYGIGAITTSDYYADFLRLLPISHSRYIVYPVFNGTDVPAHAPGTVQKIMRRAFAARAQAREVGKEVAFLILNHDASQDGGVNQDARNTAIAQLYASGAPILDARTVIGQTSNQNLWIPAYTTDGTHPSNAGRDILAAWLPRAMARVITLDAVP